MCVQHNVKAYTSDNTGQNTHKGHAPSSRIEIKLSEHARAVGLEGRDSTAYATAEDLVLYSCNTNIKIIKQEFI